MDSKRKKIQFIQGLSLIITLIIFGTWIANFGYPRSQVWGLLQVVPSSPQSLNLITWVLFVLLLMVIVIFSILTSSQYFDFLSENHNHNPKSNNDSKSFSTSEEFDQNNLKLPNRQERINILKTLTSGMNLQKNIDLNLIARTTTSFSSSDLRMLCELANQIASKEGRQAVTMHDFEQALDQHLVSSLRSPLLDDNLRQLVSYHIAGHTLAAWLIPQAEVIYTASLLAPPNKCLELCSANLEAGIILSKQELTACLAVLLAGRAAEEVIYGDVTNYSSNDLLKAMEISRQMIVNWGMGQLGPVAFSSTGSDTNTLSEATKASIDKNVQRLLEERYSFVKNLLITERDNLEDLAELLCEEETLKREQIAQVLGDRIFRADMFSVHL